MEYQLFVGAYTGDVPGTGVMSLGFDEERLWEISSAGGLTNPSYVCPEREYLYGVEELPDTASVFRLGIDQEGRFTQFERWEVPGAGLCHVVPVGPCLFVSGYAGGTLTGLGKSDGKTCYYNEFQGCGPNVFRQERAHIHSAQASPDGTRLLVADLGSDKVYQFVLQKDGSLEQDKTQPWAATGAGQGPRHFAFHPNGEWIYLVTELDRSLLVFRYEDHRLEQTAQYSLRQPSDPESSLAADVHVTADGRFLYASVRGADCIYGFRVLEEGGLALLGRFSSGGSCPRSFALSPDDRYVAVANQETGNLCVFPRDSETGILKPVVCAIELPQVSCVKWRAFSI